MCLCFCGSASLTFAAPCVCRAFLSLLCSCPNEAGGAEDVKRSRARVPHRLVERALAPGAYDVQMHSSCLAYCFIFILCVHHIYDTWKRRRRRSGGYFKRSVCGALDAVGHKLWPVGSSTHSRRVALRCVAFRCPREDFLTNQKGTKIILRSTIQKTKRRNGAPRQR